VYVDIIISKDTLNKYGYLIKHYYGMSIRGVLLLKRSQLLCIRHTHCHRVCVKIQHRNTSHLRQPFIQF